MTETEPCKQIEEHAFLELFSFEKRSSSLSKKMLIKELYVGIESLILGFIQDLIDAQHAYVRLVKR